MSKPEQYVGVSGGADTEEQEHLFENARAVGVGEFDAFVMWGIQASDKTQIDERPTKHGEDWHPVGDDIENAGMVDKTGLTRPFIHIYGGEDDIDRQKETIKAVLTRTDEFRDGIQLNRLDWQLPVYDGFMREVRELAGDNCAIVLQCHERVTDALGPAALTERLQHLAPDYVLFDASHGKGKVMNPEDVRAYIDAIYQEQLDVGVAVAGGLDGETLHDAVGPLFQEFPDLSCDAEGKLRAGEPGATELDMYKVVEYLKAWVSMMEEIRGSGE